MDSIGTSVGIAGNVWTRRNAFYRKKVYSSYFHSNIEGVMDCCHEIAWA